MLILVGLGLYIDLLPLRSLAALARCDKVLIDAYTSAPREAVERVYEVLRAMGKRVSLAKREDLEGESIARIAEEARHSDVCIAVLGDPLIATTHSAICTEAASRGVKVVVIPAPSIHCASITATGLMSYRFGRSVTLVTPKNGVFYEYPYDVIKENLSLNLHTLLLLEMDAEKGFFMDPCEAGRLLMELEKRRGEGVLRSDTLVVVLSRVASPRH
ncbi:MAG: diphthine synthase, partial [Thermoprotei archaeon]